MRRILLSILLAGSLVGFARAQETTGPAAEKVKKEILKLEEEKRQAFLSTASSHNYCADWVKRVDADDLDHTNLNGSVDTKAELMDQLNTGARKIVAMNYHDFHIRVYGKGGNYTTAVVTYFSDNTHEDSGVRSSSKTTRALDVFVKVNGQWRFVAHGVHNTDPNNPTKN